jgi:hydrogenase/urease accessory protein HupE
VRRRAPVAGVLLALAWAPHAAAHEARPGFLELRETGPETYSLLWKKPTGGEVEIQIAPVVPEGCRLATPDRQQLTPGAMIVRGTLSCAGGLAGKTIAIAGLDATITDVLLRVHHADGRLESHLLRPASPYVTLGAVTGLAERALGYVQLGVQHILLGVDHLLFVLGLVLLVGPCRQLVATITAFTLGHSVTLTLAALDVARVPPAPVEVLIAFSIFVLAVELARPNGEATATLMRRRPWLMAAAFGLLHGLGFAGTLRAAGLPSQAIPTALLGFNAGIEIGQLAFVLTIVAARSATRPALSRLPAWSRALPVYAMGSLAACWMIQRALPLF